MKERFVRMGILLNGSYIYHYIKEIKNHWWNKWKIVMDGAAPLIFYKLPEGVRAINELPKFKNIPCAPATEHLRACVSHIAPPPPPFPKGDPMVRESMIDMVRNADEIYVGIKQDGKYYLANDTKSVESCRDLQTLEIIGDGDED